MYTYFNKQLYGDSFKTADTTHIVSAATLNTLAQLKKKKGTNLHGSFQVMATQALSTFHQAFIVKLTQIWHEA